MGEERRSRCIPYEVHERGIARARTEKGRAWLDEEKERKRKR